MGYGKGVMPSRRILVTTTIALSLGGLAGCNLLFGEKKSDRRAFLDTCVKYGADRNASLAATEALEKAGCGLGGCKDWVFKVKGVCVTPKPDGENKLAVYTTIVVRTLYEPREEICDAVRNHVQEKGSASVYCDPGNRCSTTCGKARAASK